MGLKNHILTQNKNLRQKIKFIKDTFSRHGDYLAEGRYKISFYPRMVIYKKSFNSKEFINKLKNDAKKRKSVSNKKILIRFKILISKIITFFYRIPIRVMLYNFKHQKLGQTGYSCSLLFAQAQGGGLKMITFSKKKTLIFLNSIEDFNNIKNVYETTPREINVPKMKFISEDKLVIEDLINNIPIDELNTNLLSRAMHQYHNDSLKFLNKTTLNDYYLLNVDSTLNFLIDHVFDSRVLSIYDQLDFKTFKKEIEYIPLIDFKGDQQLNHFLITLSEYYLIDFENTQKISVLHLFLTNIKDAFYVFGFNSLMKKYKQEDYDQLIHKFFSKSDCKFIPELRTEHLFISLLEFHPTGLEFYLDEDNLTQNKISKFNEYIFDFMNKYMTL